MGSLGAKNLLNTNTGCFGIISAGSLKEPENHKNMALLHLVRVKFLLGAAFFAFFFLFIGVPGSLAAIGFDASSFATSSVTSTLTISHTVSGSNRILLVNAAALDGSSTTRNVSNVTYAGSGLTKVCESDNASNANTELWYLLGPATGTNDIAVTYGGAATRVRAGGVSLVGARQIAPEATSSATGIGTAISASLTTVSDGAWVVDGVLTAGANSISVGGGQIERWNSGGASVPAAQSTEGPVLRNVSVTMSWTGTVSANWTTCAATVAQIAKPPNFLVKIGKAIIKVGKVIIRATH